MGSVWGFPGQKLVTRRLWVLLDSVYPDGRFSMQEITGTANSHAGACLLTEDYLTGLLRGEEKSPPLEVMSAIASSFGLSVAFFTSEMTDRQAGLAARAAASGNHTTMTTDQLAIEMRTAAAEAAASAVEQVLARWAASGAVVPSPQGPRPAAGPRLTTPN